MKFYIEDVRINVSKCNAPKFSDHGGRTWDHGHVQINNKIVKAYLDTSWGEYVYFRYDCAWCKVKMIPDIQFELKHGRTWDVDPFAVPPVEIKVL